jgi:hypothetical protein
VTWDVVSPAAYMTLSLLSICSFDSSFLLEEYFIVCYKSIRIAWSFHLAGSTIMWPFAGGNWSGYHYATQFQQGYGGRRRMENAPGSGFRSGAMMRSQQQGGGFGYEDVHGYGPDSGLEAMMRVQQQGFGPGFGGQQSQGMRYTSSAPAYKLPMPRYS